MKLRIRKRQSSKGYYIKGFIILTLFISLGCYGNAKLNEKTGGKPIETWALHEISGRNEVEEQWRVQTENMEEEKLRIQLEKETLARENGQLIELVSRGDNRKTKPILDYAKLSCPRYIAELMERMSAAHGFPSIATVYCIAY
jgi:hypothetical protein